MKNHEPVHIYVPGDPDDPRMAKPPPGVVVHTGPPLHPDDVTVVNGLPVTTVARTLIDLAEVMDEEELRECFANAKSKGLLDLDALAASRARVEWRPSLAMFDRVYAEFAG
jgi:hypothetical protein